MKKLVLVLVSFAILTFSCKKDEFEDLNQTKTEEVERGIELYGTWRLISGKMYIENMETGEKIVYNHFDSNKQTSSLRYSGSMYEFETIKANETKWTFIAPPENSHYGEFWLDNDSIEPYGLYILDQFWSIVEHPTADSATEMQLGGSSRPISAVVEDYDHNIVLFRVQEAYESIDGFNSNYYSELRFKKIN